MSDLLEFAGVSELSDTWGTLKELEFLQDIPLTDLEYWWSADGITTANDGDAIETLSNRVGAGSPTQPTLASRGIYRANGINGRPAIEFDGVDDFYRSNTDSAVLAFNGDDRPMTVYVVSKADATATTMFIVGMGRTTAGTTTSIRLGHINTGNYRFVKEDDAGVAVNLSTGTTILNPVLRVDLHPGTSYSFWENETLLRNATTLNVGTLTLNRLAIGSQYTGGAASSYFNGRIAEVLIYSVAHTTNTRLLISAYLKNKYRLYL